MKLSGSCVAAHNPLNSVTSFNSAAIISFSVGFY
jgi:hypothetical protein